MIAKVDRCMKNGLSRAVRVIGIDPYSKGSSAFKFRIIQLRCVLWSLVALIITVNACILYVFRFSQRTAKGEVDPLSDLSDGEDGWRSGVLRRDDVLGTDEGDDDGDQLPEHMYDVDKVLAHTPLLRKDNAFHDTLNSECVATWSIFVCVRA